MSGMSEQQRRDRVLTYMSMRILDADRISRALGGEANGVSVELIEGDLRYWREELRRERRAKLNTIGDTTLLAFDADEETLRKMMRVVQEQGQSKVSVFLKLMDMIRDIQTKRLQLAGLLSAEGQQAYRSESGTTSEAGVTDEDGVALFKLYSDELEDGEESDVGGVGSDRDLSELPAEGDA